jgi:tight adherence protein B
MIARHEARRQLARLAPPRSRPLERMLEGTRYGRRLSARLRAADSERKPAAFVRLQIAGALAGSAAAMLWAGGPAGLVGLLAGAAAPEVSVRRRIRRRSARVATQLPEVLAALSAPIRAGASLPQAFAAAAEESEPPLRDMLMRACRDLDGGVPQAEAIDAFAARCAVPEAVLAARALRVGRAAGGELARVIDEVAETIRERERLAREFHAATAQARSSATVVAALPVVFLFMSSAGSGEQLRLLFGEPAGWALLTAGGLLELAGVVWIRRIAAAAARRAGGAA